MENNYYGLIIMNNSFNDQKIKILTLTFIEKCDILFMLKEYL